MEILPCCFVFLLYIVCLPLPGSSDVRVGIIYDEDRQICYNLFNEDLATDFPQTFVSLVRFSYGFFLTPNAYPIEIAKARSLNLSAVIYTFEFELGLLTTGVNVPYYMLVSHRSGFPNRSFQLETGDLAMSEAFSDLTKAVKSFSFIIFIVHKDRQAVVEDIGLLMPNVPLASIVYVSGDAEDHFRKKFSSLSTSADPSKDIFVFVPSPSTVNMTARVLRAALYTGRLTKNQLWFFFSMFLPNELLVPYRQAPVRLITMGAPNNLNVKSEKAYQGVLCRDAIRHLIISQNSSSNNITVMGQTGPVGFDEQGYRKRFAMPYLSLNPNNGSYMQVGQWVKEGSHSSALDLMPKITLKLPKLRVARIPNSGRPFGSSDAASLDFFTSLSAVLNMEVQWVTVSSLGTFNKSSGNWSGMFGAISRGEADMGSLAVPITAEREKSFAFTPALARSAFQLVGKSRPKAWHLNLGPFSVDLWSGVAIGLFLQCLTVLAVSKLSSGTTTGALYVVFSGATLSRMPLPSRNPSLRFLALCFSLTAFFLMASYAAHSAALAVSRARIKVEEADETITSGPDYLAASASSASPLWFLEAESVSLEVLQKANYTLAKSMAMAARRWWPNGTKMYVSGGPASIGARLNQNFEMFVGYTDITQAVIQTSSGCTLRRFGNPFGFHENSLPIRKDWALKDKVLEQITKIPLQSQTDLSDEDACDKVIQVDLHDLLVIFIMLASGAVASIIVGIFEVLSRNIAERLKHNKFTTVHFEFGKTYKANVMDIETDGVLISIEGRYEREFIPYSRLPKQLGAKKGQEIPVKYFGKSPLSGTRLFVHADIKDVN